MRGMTSLHHRRLGGTGWRCEIALGERSPELILVAPSLKKKVLTCGLDRDT